MPPPTPPKVIARADREDSNTVSDGGGEGGGGGDEGGDRGGKDDATSQLAALPAT